MSDRPVHLIIQDMLDSMNDIATYTKGLTEKDFNADKKTRDAVERNLEIIGEAANRLPQEIYLRHNEVEWHRVIALRNRLIHGYFSIKNDIIWNVIINYLPKLKLQLEEIQNQII